MHNAVESTPSPRERLTRLICLVQGWFYVITGVWPLVHYRSFIAVTGPKTDDWLVLTVAGLVLVSGAVLLLAVRRRNIDVEIGVLAAGQAAVLCLADILSVKSAGISSIYLLDSLGEATFVLAWLIAWKLPHDARRG